MKYDYPKYLHKIKESESFVHSPNIKNLLQYLTECSLKGEPAKELQIAVDVFNRNLSENEQDSAIVRVNVHNLRKKLNHYYLTEGKDDSIQFVIPKGRYEVEIIKKNANTESKSYRSLWNTKQIIIYLFIVIASSLISIYLFQRVKNSTTNKINETKIWKDFTESNKKTMLVIGDYYFIKEKDTILNRNRVIRDMKINSYQDLVDFITQYPEYSTKYSQAGFTYTGYSTPYILKELIPVICSSEIEVCLMSQFNAKYLQDYNIIFIGLYKTMGYFRTFLEYSGFVVDEDNGMVIINENKATDNKYFKQEGGAESLHNDYAIAAKIKGPNDNFLFLFTSFHDIGIIECVKQLTNAKTLAMIQKNIGINNRSNNQGFEILFQVVGVNRNDLSSKIIKINQLDSISIFGNIK